MGTREKMRPRLRRQVTAFNPFTATRRSLILKHNISDFFKELYSEIVNGKTKTDPWGSSSFISSEDPERRHYSYNPDVTRVENRRRIDTEVKATGISGYKIHSPVKQESNNLCEFLVKNERGRNPMTIEYAFFMYGPRKLELNNVRAPSFMRNLSASQKKLLVVPFNLFLFLLYSARHERRNQTSSHYGRDEQSYHVITCGKLNKLFRGEAISNLLKGDKASLLLEQLCLTDLKPESSMSKKIDVFYRVHATIEPFPIVRYSMNKADQKKVASFLRENHEGITDDLHLIDLYAQMKKIPFY